ncbi:MAG: glutaredoxin family protein [Dehalococcoidia bacterium]
MDMMAKRVIVYTQPHCASCQQVTDYLRERGVDYELKDVAGDGAALRELAALGFMTTPVTIVGETAIAGFQRKKLERVLSEHGNV